MSLIPDEIVERVRDAADVVEIIGEHVDLRRTGADYRGPCPFHGGTNRNFSVIPRKQMFYCFVCHEAGDVFSFHMKRLGMDYPQAVREVAGRVGIEIPERPTGGADPNEPLYSAVGVAAEWYARRLREADDASGARNYLVSRDFQLDAIAPYGLGFAPKGDAFLKAMDGLGIGGETLLEAGLAVRREDGSLRPRFWGRLLFPIHDIRGRVVAFGGRILGDGEPKYLNSPDSRIFHKGLLLYNLHAARHAIRKDEQVICVEGYFDVIRLVEAGIENVVAALGTAFTPDQARLVKRYAPEAVLFYDSDPAGLRATFRAADELLRASVRTSVATAPPGQDPDTLVQAGGADALRRLVQDAIDVFERKLQLLERKGWLASLSGKRRALDRLLPTLRAAADPVTRDMYINRAAEALAISATAIHTELNDAPPLRPPPRPASAPAMRKTPLVTLLAVAVRWPEHRGWIRDELREWPDESLERVVLEAVLATPAEWPVGELFEVVGADGRALLESAFAREDFPEVGSESDDFDARAVVLGAIRQLQLGQVDRKVKRGRRDLAVQDINLQAQTMTEQRPHLERKRALNAERFPSKGGTR